MDIGSQGASPPGPPELRTARLSDLELAFHESGDGPLVVLLHGFPDTARAWDRHREALAARGFRVVAPYLRGYAPSGIPAADTTALRAGRDVIELLDALGVAHAHAVVGHDWGALAAHAAVALAEERFARLVTLAIPHPTGFRPTLGDAWRARHFVSYKLPGAPGRFARDDLAGLRAIVARWSPTWSVPDGEFDDVRRAFSDPRSLQGAFGYYRAFSWNPPAFLRKKLSLPTLAIAGRDDGAAPLRAFEEARRKYTGEYRVEILPCGHFPHRERPDDVERLLREFL